MRLFDVLLLAYEALTANKLRAGLTMLGMIIGVGAVVLLVSIGNGARNYIMSEFEGMGTNLIAISPGKTDKRSMGGTFGGGRKKLTIEDVEALEKLGFNLEAVTGLMFGNVAAKQGDNVSHVQMLGVNDRFSKIFNVPLRVGDFFNRDEENAGRRVVVLGHNLSKNLFGEGNPIGQSVKINESEHRVVGILQKSGNTLGFNMDDMLIIPTRAAQRIMNDDKLLGIRVRARSKAGIDDAVQEITEILKARMDGEDDFTIHTQLSMLSTMNTILGMLTWVLGGIAMISMIVGGIGIMNIMLVSVTERTREIGIRRAVGARRIDILKQFIAEALALSITGGMLGLIGSISITYLAWMIVPKFDMRAPTWVLWPSFLMSVGTGLVFGVWPARKASRIETIDALRYE